MDVYKTETLRGASAGSAEAKEKTERWQPPTAEEAASEIRAIEMRRGKN